MCPSERCASRFFFTAHAARRDPSCVPLLRFRSPSGLAPEGFARHLSMRAPLLRISHRLAHSFRESPHTPVLPTARVKVRIQGFSPSLRLSPLSASQVYFTPLTPFGFTLQGFPLSRSLDNSSLSNCRLAVFPMVALPPPSIAGPSAHLTSLLGLRRWCLGPASRPCSP